MRGRAATRLAGVGGAVLLVAACTSTVGGHGKHRTSAPRGTNSSAPATATPGNSCGAYAAPDPHRPKMTLQYTIAAGHRTVHGHEAIEFRPDRSITELVFRLTANTRPTVAEGNKVTVTAASADHGAGRFRFTAANAAPSTQGGLLHIPFQRRLAAGTDVHAAIDFVLTLGAESFDRFGRAGAFAYFGSGEPLLAWQRGFGWHTEDMIDFPAESATSEAMDVDLTVIAPAGDTVIASGDPRPAGAAGGTRTWHSHIATARDVSVAAGPFQVSDTTVDGVRLRVGAPTTAVTGQLVPEFRRAITELQRRYGPFPFPSLSVARVPAGGGGVEYPSSILMLDGSRLVAVHETAHQWFYGMIGDSQALHPWLDEAFAQYSEELVDHEPPHAQDLNAPGPVDASTESYGQDQERYYFTTYNKGSAALEAARQAAGPAKWDAALRCYVARNAWRIVDPADFKAALSQLPAAVRVLQKAGALK
jgi:hypothetical protein